MSQSPFEIVVDNEMDNRLLLRKELEFTLSFKGKGTPNRLEVRKKLAAMKAADEEVVFIRQLKPRFGAHEVNGLAMIYDDVEAAKTEPEYVKIRNSPKDQREDLRNAEKKKKKKKKKTKT